MPQKHGWNCWNDNKISVTCCHKQRGRMKWIKIPDSALPKEEGEIRKVKIGPKAICLVQHRDRLYATSARCPHAGADLSSGWCEGGKLICSFHRHAFNLENGRGDPGQGNYVRIFPIEQRTDGVYFGQTEGWFSKIFRK